MTGELILKSGVRWKQILPAVVLTAGVTFAVVWPMMTRMKGDGLMWAAMAALMTYVLWRVLYPLLVKLMPGGEKPGAVVWELRGDVLQLGEDTIPLDSIKMVHCWPNRDALGHRLEGWTVNIETTGKNRVLCSVEDGPQVQASEESVHALVTALGYESSWVEE